MQLMSVATWLCRDSCVVRRCFAQVPPCLIGIEACGAARYWARELSALGHDVRLMPPVYLKPYVKRQENDAADAQAICEAVTRASGAEKESLGRNLDGLSYVSSKIEAAFRRIVTIG
ncbi:hypothetical protein At15955_51210 (plasmid) [Agrobacterium tumefaciens]|nr:transposase [Agrobacterium tumefaciens]AYM20106.1 hypothetical protein At15955_51210 [Agrobacterium tumefaciens]AYM71409.1 hypothetical protein AtA6_51930 [Agrobacterium tumefaciens]CUX05040.1 hypothetical protein AGR1C_pAt20085 [Agrobacterium fabacearum TT111]